MIAATPWEQRWQAALSTRDGTCEAEGFAERTVANDLSLWSEPALGARDRLRAWFRLEVARCLGTIHGATAVADKRR